MEWLKIKCTSFFSKEDDFYDFDLIGGLWDRDHTWNHKSDFSPFYFDFYHELEIIINIVLIIDPDAAERSGILASLFRVVTSNRGCFTLKCHQNVTIDCLEFQNSSFAIFHWQYQILGALQISPKCSFSVTMNHSLIVKVVYSMTRCGGYKALSNVDCFLLLLLYLTYSAGLCETKGLFQRLFLNETQNWAPNTLYKMPPLPATL